ncbi:MAG TPA: molybdenum cofactor biosynthesis protein B [Tepidisphaeraceae bacterium]|jgi:molybdenum cofactor biosynthesis protein B|nr:molybdenum cofactor biosynthesis protein B [Tepidisphaeraceae bacterium]
MSYHEHQRAAAGEQVGCAVVTLSDTRTLENDTGGATVVALLTAGGHAVRERRLIADDPALLDALLTELLGRVDIDAIITTGGTGINRRDATIEVVRRRLQQELPGFGELFRMLSFEQIGSGAMLSRAIGGILGGKVIFSLPGSVKAVELGMTRLIVPELRHVVRELRK